MDSVWIGFDPREADAFAVARSSARYHLNGPIPIKGVVLSSLQEAGLYTRPTRRAINSDGRFEMVDELSISDTYDGRLSTEHANARFLVPHLAKSGWALFMDGDVLVRKNLNAMMRGLDREKAVYCVQHRHEPEPGVKMDGQVQTRYARKNWTSVMLWNVGHEANSRLTVEMVNTLPGRDLHRLCWLEDDEIGELEPEWNFLIGHTDPAVDPCIAHFTDGTPAMAGYEDVPFSDEWRAELRRWAA